MSLQNETLFLEGVLRNKRDDACGACNTVSGPERTLGNWQHRFLIIARQCRDAARPAALSPAQRWLRRAGLAAPDIQALPPQSYKLSLRHGSSGILTNSQNHMVKFQTPRFPEIFIHIGKRSNAVENDEKDSKEICRIKQFQLAGSMQNVHS